MDKYMTVRVDGNWITGRSGVNRSRTLFDESACPFTEITSGDFGRDAFVELSFTSERILGCCITLQIKGGRSFKRSSGNYFIPVQQHAKYWHESNIPLIGIVHDPDVGKLFWCNISEYLRENGLEIGSIPVPQSNELNGKTIEENLKPSVLNFIAENPSWVTYDEATLLSAFRNVCESESATQLNGVLDLLALSRRRPSIVIILRHLISKLHMAPFRLALQIIAAATVAEEVVLKYEEVNQAISFSTDWFTQDSRNQIEKHLAWSIPEIKILLESVAPEEWHPTDFGFLVWLILSTDGNQEHSYRKLESAAKQFVVEGKNTLAGLAIELALEQYVEDGSNQLKRMVEEFPEFAKLPVYPLLLEQLEYYGEVTFFSG